MNESSITLSICIPTFNRARLLNHALSAAVPQVRAAADLVELVVIDNCSDDETERVASGFIYGKTIRYIRNERNVGGCPNIMRSVECARGRFVWILGDDDLLREDAVSRVLQVIRSNHDLAYLYVNVSMYTLTGSDELNTAPRGKDFPLQPAMASDLSERKVARWEELVDPQINNVFLGSIMSSVFRRDLWLTVSNQVNASAPFGSSVDSVYPHLSVFAKCMVGRPSYYLGYPCVVARSGAQTWLEFVPLIATVILHEVLDMYLKAGVPVQRIDKCRRHLLLTSGTLVLKHLLPWRRSKKVRLNLSGYLKRHAKYSELWQGLFIRPAMNAVQKLIPSWKWSVRVQAR